MKLHNLIVFIPLAAISIAAASCRTAQTAAPPRLVENAGDVIAAMHDRYADSWYSTLRFRQKVTYPATPARPQEIWLEHAEIPGKLRIDLGENYTGRGQIFSGDSVFVFDGGKTVRRIKSRNPLMVLGFDVYRQPVDRSLAVLRDDGFDMTRFRTDTWQGRPVYVIGADAGDLRAKQFWIDQERLVFVRLIMPAGPGGTRTSEIRFDRYEPFGGAWISPYVVFLTDGVETMVEEYYDMEANIPIPDGLFDPDRIGTVRPRER